MAKFKIGDRVRVIEFKEQEWGNTGTVIEVSTNPWVCFDKPTRYGGDPNPRNGWKAGFMDCMSDDRLELVSAGELSVPVAIDAYQQACTDFEAAQLAVEKAKAAVQDARLNLRDALDGES